MKNSDILNSLLAEALPFVESWLRGIVRDEVSKTLNAERENARPPRLYSIQEVCELAHITKPTLWRKEREGKIKGTRSGRRVLFSELEVKRLIRG